MKRFTMTFYLFDKVENKLAYIEKLRTKPMTEEKFKDVLEKELESTKKFCKREKLYFGYEVTK